MIVLQVIALRGLWQPGEPMGGDLTIHLAEAAHLSRAIDAGDADAWSPMANLGYAPGYYYQAAPQLGPALVHRALGGAVPLLPLFKLFLLLPLVLATASVHRALRALGASPWRAVAGAAATACVCADSRWGHGPDGLFGPGAGLYTQAWAMVWLPLALAAGWRHVRDGGGRTRALVLVLATGLCHPLIGVIAAALVAIAPLACPDRRAAAARAAALVGLAAAASAFAWLPILVHYDSFGGFPMRDAEEAGLGAAGFARALATGRLLDDGRLPVLTLGVAAAIVAAWRGDALARALLVPAALLAAPIAAGRALGAVGDDLVPWVRFLAPLQLLLAAAAGVALLDALAALARRTDLAAPPSLRTRLAPAAAALLGAGVLAAIVPPTAARLERRVWCAGARADAHRDDLARLTAALRDAPPGRVLVSRTLDVPLAIWRYVPFIDAERPVVIAYGGAPLQSSPAFAHLARPDTIRLWRTYGIRYLVVPPHARDRFPPGRTLVATPVAALVDLGDAPLFRPVTVTAAAPPERAARATAIAAWIESEAPERGEHLAIGDNRGHRAPPAARVLAWGSGPSRYHADVAVDGPGPSTIALAVTYHPGWRVTIDGRAAPVRRLSPDVLAVDVPAGRHAIVFTFARPWWTWALLAFAAALVAAVALAARRSAARHPEPS